MKMDIARALAVTPIFVYAIGEAWGPYGGANSTVLLSFALTGVVILAPLLGAERWLVFLPGVVLGGTIAALWGFAAAVPTGAFADIGAGVLLASPLLFLAGVWVSESSPGISIAVALVGLSDCIGLLATRATLAAPGSLTGSEALLGAFGAVQYRQAVSISDLLLGTVPTSIPMGAVGDATFLFLGIVAMLGLLLSLLRGRTLDWARSGSRPLPANHPRSSAKSALSVPREFARVLSTATRPELPEFPSIAGLVPVVAAAVAAFAFLVLAAELPSSAFLAVAGGLAIGLVLLARGPRAVRARASVPSRPRGA